MKSIARMLVMTTLLVLLIFVVAFARELGAREAREKIAPRSRLISRTGCA